MPNNPDDELREKILQFLSDFKTLMRQDYFTIKDNHLKNRDTLLKLGLTYKNRNEEIFNLSLENYSSGPSMDALHKGYYWVFGKLIGDDEIYIKLKIVECGNGDEYALCYSFHISEAPLKYPFRQ
jgi:hypothetical protein